MPLRRFDTYAAPQRKENDSGYMTYSGRASEESPALQAADMLAYEWGMEAAFKLGRQPKGPRWQVQDLIGPRKSDYRERWWWGPKTYSTLCR